MFRVILLASMMFIASSLYAQQEREFEGRWNNQRTGSNGTMTCQASETAPGQWKGVFRGVFQGRPFEFRVDFQSRGNRTESQLMGTSTIEGQNYQWEGLLSANQLRGRYRASNGWNGEFVLNETAASRRNTSNPVEPPPIEDVEIKPIIRDGAHLLFVGNELMANEGGLANYLQTALKKRNFEITHESKITEGKSLKEMVTREIGDAMMATQVNVVVITSGDLVTMKQFATKLKTSGKKLVVFLTWEPKHPGNQATAAQYTSATQKAVRLARQMEKETGATVIPAAVLYHDLTIRPPQGMPRVDYLWKQRDVNQNALGNMVNALLLSAMLTGESPVGLNFDFPPQIVGQKLEDEPDLRLTRELRDELQYRAWSVAQAWARGKTHLE